MTTTEHLLPTEMNEIERMIVDAEAGRDHHGQTVRGVRLDARTARMLFDMATGAQFQENIAQLKAELDQEMCASRENFSRYRSAVRQIEDLQRRIDVIEKPKPPAQHPIDPLLVSLFS